MEFSAAQGYTEGRKYYFERFNAMKYLLTLLVIDDNSIFRVLDKIQRGCNFIL